MAEVIMTRTQNATTGKDCFHFFMKRPTKKAKALVENGTLYSVGCEVSDQFVKDNPGWVTIGCEDDAHAYSNQGIAERARGSV